MGKVSPQSIKYIIHAKFSAEGVVEKPDIIGAIFGQTEGLLGEELELRELQKMGKIGRINVELEINESKTQGTIEIPTSIDKTETAIIGAAIETIDRIGPCEANFQIMSIEDVRSSKRKYVIERAKKLLAGLSTGVPTLREMQQDVINHVKTARISEYGCELLAAGPDIDTSNEIIVVEGRADVLNLLKAGIKNVIAMNGTVIPRTIKELSKEKEITLFIDGDRGGILIAIDALQNANIKYIARAPDGKEVEELVDKEVFNCLRNKMTIEEFSELYLKKSKKKKVKEESRDIDIEERLRENLLKLEKGQSMLLLGNMMNFRKKTVLESEILKVLYDARRKKMQVFALITNGIVTAPIIKAAEEVNCSYIAAKNFAATSEKIKLLSF